MNDATRPDDDLPTASDHPSACALDALVRAEQERAFQVQELRNEVAKLRDSLAEEVRTKRIRITDDRGFDRVLLTGDRQTARVAVHARGGADGESTCLELVAQEGSWESPEYLAVIFTERGNIVGGYQMLEDQAPQLFVTVKDRSAGSGGSMRCWLLMWSDQHLRPHDECQRA